jgi:ABC-type cobalt transport system substrate-binding protein
MKKVWKYILSILLVVILASAGTIYYFLNIKTYDIADEEVKEIIESEYDIILPGEPGFPEVVNNNNNDSTNSGESSTDSGSNVTNDDNSEAGGSTSDNKSDATSTTGKTNTGKVVPNKNSTNNSSKPNKDTNGSTEQEETVMTIKNKYRPVFQSLESQANSKIDALLSKAFGEYQSKKNNGEAISYSYFYQKYTSAGRALENNTDGAFNYIYKALENELKAHGYSTTHAKAFKEQYEETKKARESALLNKAKEAL